MIKSAVLLLCVACLLASVTCQWRPRPRCPRGHVGGRRCSGWVPNSCPPGSFCYAPADAGYCCRRRGGGGAQFLDEDLFLMLQSVVMACQSRDLEALEAIQVELWPKLSAEQNQLIYLVIRELAHPSGEGL